ncbi:hypothetical protein BEL07_01145 [Mycolicibacterium grossiae]|uniref:Uncharacterized protein n=1 Tax=Mycolicibacterium grossiae TaxID=1552759 RepID=A0A1E8QAS0_9MYCO|nr:hypothetical protein BEL07_01145 [Mycolicibacterium grossiae]
MIRHVVHSPSSFLVIDSFGSAFGDCGHLHQVGVVVVGAVDGPIGDHADLIQGDAALTQACRAAQELLAAAGDGDDGVGSARRDPGAPSH